MNNTSKKFTHIRKNDLPSMVDVSDKSVTERKAVATLMLAKYAMGHGVLRPEAAFRIVE